MPETDLVSAVPEVSSFERWGMAERLAWEQAVDEALGVDLDLNLEELDQAAVRHYLLDLGFTSDEAVRAWMRRERVGETDLMYRAIRHQRWLKVCQDRWGHLLANQYLKRKEELDSLRWSCLYLDEYDMLFELYMRVKEDEIEMAELLSQFPQAEGSDRCGFFGPMPLSAVPEALKDRLKSSPVGELIKPFQMDQGWAFAKVEDKTSTMLDDKTRRLLLLELGEQNLVLKRNR